MLASDTTVERLKLYTNVDSAVSCPISKPVNAILMMESYLAF